MYPSYVASPVFDMSVPKRLYRPSELRNRNMYNKVYIDGYTGYGNIRNQQYEDLLDSLQFPCDDDSTADSAASPETKYPQTKPIPVNTQRRVAREEPKKEKPNSSITDQVFVLMLHTQLNAIQYVPLEEALQKYVILYM